MKKVVMMMALLAIPFAMMAQTKFHDVAAPKNGPPQTGKLCYNIGVLSDRVDKNGKGE